jgi:hypothetical protein
MENNKLLTLLTCAGISLVANTSSMAASSSDQILEETEGKLVPYAKSSIFIIEDVFVKSDGQVKLSKNESCSTNSSCNVNGSCK